MCYPRITDLTIEVKNWKLWFCLLRYINLIDLYSNIRQIMNFSISVLNLRLRFWATQVADLNWSLSLFSFPLISNLKLRLRLTFVLSSNHRLNGWRWKLEIMILPVAINKLTDIYSNIRQILNFSMSVLKLEIKILSNSSSDLNLRSSF